MVRIAPIKTEISSTIGNDCNPCFSSSRLYCRQNIRCRSGKRKTRPINSTYSPVCCKICKLTNVVFIKLRANLQQIFGIHKDLTVKIKFICIFLSFSPLYGLAECSFFAGGLYPLYGAAACGAFSVLSISRGCHPRSAMFICRILSGLLRPLARHLMPGHILLFTPRRYPTEYLSSFPRD